MVQAATFLQVFDPRGRINRQGLLWLATGLVAFQVAICVVLWSGLYPTNAPLVAVAKAVFIWISFTATVKRLHDIGRSGLWMLAAVAALVAWAAVIASVLVYGYGLSALQPQGHLYWVALGVMMMPVLVATLWLHIAKGHAGINRYGPPPGSLGMSGPNPASAASEELPAAA
ncbi:MAG TPA: DUF805 domain-containing protein [Hyphomicrobiaceae bacterium]|nr:DUF805 domain-containing protein [Hyphomicrobiaceae bacterium]